jgi:DNA-binding HxlR family transcriptional regulator
MTPNQIKILLVVARNTNGKGSRMNFSDLEECLPDIKFGFLNQALEGLHRAGFIGKRKTNLRLTQRGWHIYRAIQEVWDG